MGKGFGIFLAVLGAVSLFLGTTFIPFSTTLLSSYPSLGDYNIIIGIILLAIGVLITFYPRKSDRY